MDGMSSFGVKTPLRKEIIASDFYWSKACELVGLFHSKGFHSPSIIYSEISVQAIAAHNSVKAIPLKGHTKDHVIVYYPDSKIARKQALCDCEMCIAGDIEQCFYFGCITNGHVNDENEVDDLDEDGNEDEDGSI